MSDLREQLGESLAAFRDLARNAGLRRLELAYAGSETGGWLAQTDAFLDTVEFT